MALDGGADIIDFADFRREAMGAVTLDTVAAAVAAIGAPCTISAALDASAYDARGLANEAAALAAAGVDTLRLAAEAGALDGAALSELAREMRLVGVLFADRGPDLGSLERLERLGFKGALLDVAEKGPRRLLDHMAPHQIEAFVRRCRQLGLSAWLAGSLQSPDVPRLMLLEPDVLGFRSALCFRGRRDGPLDPRRIAVIRDLIPRNSPFSSEAEQGKASAWASDAIFVHDFLTTAEIGAYAHERGVRQRLLFNVDVAVSRVSAHADDMRAVVSYDVILDAVRIVVGRGHIDFIETVAEEVAAIVLRHPRVREVRVKVEKLDVVAGSVGVEIVRGR